MMTEIIEANSKESIHSKIKAFYDQKIKIKFRLKDDPSYEVRGLIKVYSENEIIEHHYCINYQITIELENGILMPFYVNEILEHTLFPLDYDPIVKFNRVSIPEKLRNFILNRDNYECQINLEGCTKVAEHIDHIIPVSKGGLNVPDNLQSSCKNCNLKKGDKIIY